MWVSSILNLNFCSYLIVATLFKKYAKKKLLQILCQILNTESMQEIQSWLVSSGYNGSFIFFEPL